MHKITVKDVDRLIDYYKKEIGEYHLKRLGKKDVETLLKELACSTLEGHEDLMYLYGAIHGLTHLKNKYLSS